jgi:predicted nucleotidyltransferase
MRLSLKDQQGIAEAIKAKAPAADFELYLFGSRVDDSAKGGDIDLLILCDTGAKEDFLSVKSKILLEIEKRIGERRVDLTVSSRDPFEQSDFVKVILQKAIRL